MTRAVFHEATMGETFEEAVAMAPSGAVKLIIFEDHLTTHMAAMKRALLARLVGKFKTALEALEEGPKEEELVAKSTVTLRIMHDTNIIVLTHLAEREADEIEELVAEHPLSPRKAQLEDRYIKTICRQHKGGVLHALLLRVLYAKEREGRAT